MTEDRASWPNVDKFIFDQIDSVPHLEALLLIWSSRPMPWAAEDLAKRLYIELSFAKTISQDLARQNLIAPGEDGRYYYEPNPERDEL
ncbi:MAG TPA: hypothetical protein VFW83_02210, partial [Bryobacteraceae bacterium]|nr:hypothetical protein [Bryobacteraceae bacterium]